MATSVNLGLMLPGEYDYIEVDTLSENFEKLDAAYGDRTVKYADVVDNLTTSDATVPLSAKQGKKLGAEKVNIADVIDTLDSEETKKPLSANQGRVLKKAIDDKAITTDFVFTLSASGWSSAAPYTQTITVDGVKVDMDPMCDIQLSSDETTALDELAGWAYVGRIVTNDGTVTVTCYRELPLIDLTVKMKVVV